jgi:serine/threonine protein kinase
MEQPVDDSGRAFLQNLPRALTHMRFDHVIGQGGYGVVFSAFDSEHDMPVAVKIVSRQLLEEASVLTAFEQELRIHETLDHPNIVKIFSIIYGRSFIYMVLELCSGGDLLNYIHKTDYRPLIRTLGIFTQILSAIAYLHSRGIAHLDIKPENILMCPADRVKLADFGCCEAPPKVARRSAVGTLFYAAPEIYARSRVDNRAADVWSPPRGKFTWIGGCRDFPPYSTAASFLGSSGRRCLRPRFCKSSTSP